MCYYTKERNEYVSNNEMKRYRTHSRRVQFKSFSQTKYGFENRWVSWLSYKNEVFGITWLLFVIIFATTCGFFVLQINITSLLYTAVFLALPKSSSLPTFTSV